MILPTFIQAKENADKEVIINEEWIIQKELDQVIKDIFDIPNSTETSTERKESLFILRPFFFLYSPRLEY